MKNTLIIIFAFIALTLGSFIYFIATWDAEARDPVVMIPNASDRA